MKTLKANIYFTGSPDERKELREELEELSDSHGAKIYIDEDYN